MFCFVFFVYGAVHCINGLVVDVYGAVHCINSLVVFYNIVHCINGLAVATFRTVHRNIALAVAVDIQLNFYCEWLLNDMREESFYLIMYSRAYGCLNL